MIQGHAAAIHHRYFSSDVTGSVAGKLSNGIRYFRRQPQASHGRTAHDLSLGIVAGQRGFGRQFKSSRAQGATAFTRTPCGASDSAMTRVSWLMPPLLTL